MDSLFNTVKQGSQLFKESTEGASNLASQAGLSEKPGSPQETAVIGGTPSQAKMAGTPAALQSAAQVQKPKLPTSLTLATQLRREQVKPEHTEQLQKAQELSQRLASLGSLGQRVPQIIQQGVSQAIQGVSTAPQIDTSKFPSTLSPAQQDQLKSAIETLSAPSSDANKQQQSNATAEIATLTGMKQADLETPGALNKFFKTAPASMTAAIDSATLNAINLGDLQGGSQSLGYPSWDNLATDLGIEVPTGKKAEDIFRNMTVKQLGDTVDTVKRLKFQTQDEWRSVLQDPTSSLQDRAVARSILQNMGASGVREAETSVAQLTEQVQAANRVTLNLTGTPKSYSIEDILNKDTLKASLSILLNPNDPAYKSVADANPALKEWADKNKDQLAAVVKDVDQDQKNLAAVGAENAKVFNLASLPPDAQAAIGKAIYPNSWGGITPEKYDLSKAPLLQNWSSYSPDIQKNVGGALSALADGGSAEDMTQFLNAKPDQLVALGLNTDTGLQNFQSFWNQMKTYRKFNDPAHTVNAVTDVMALTGGYSPARIQELNSEDSALGGLGGFPSDLKGIQRIVSQSPKSLTDLINGGKIPETVGSLLKKLQNRVESQTTSADLVTSSLAKAVTQNKGPLNSTQKQQVAQQVTDGQTPEVALKNLESLEIRTGTKFKELKTKFAGDQINQTTKAVGLPDFDRAMEEIRKNPEKNGEILNRYREAQKGIKSGFVYNIYAQKLKKLDSDIAQFMKSQGAPEAVIGTPGPSQMETGIVGPRFIS